MSYGDKKPYCPEKDLVIWAYIFFIVCIIGLAYYGGTQV